MCPVSISWVCTGVIKVSVTVSVLVYTRSRCGQCLNTYRIWNKACQWLYCKFGIFFARALLSKIKPSRNSKITLLFTDIGKSCLSWEFWASKICLLNALRENKILTKKSEFTVFKKHCKMMDWHTVQTHIRFVGTYC